MKTLEINANANYTSDWIFKDAYSSTFTKSSVQIKWHGITGTANGTIKVEMKTDRNADLTTVLDTVNVNSASNASDNMLLSVNYAIKAYRITYTKNDITAGDIIIKIDAE
ncbi:MAG: hypothetical protein KF896_14440 [Ignavibacteriae bacterium]|nr:hypothetical protein [Ignavibacteriota bacterium]